MEKQERAPNNRTLRLKADELEELRAKLISEKTIQQNENIVNKTLNGDILAMLKYIPDHFANLIIIDPPYNLTKDFGGLKFTSRSQDSYYEYLKTWFPQICKKLKENGSLYMCGDWRSTSSMQRAIEEELSILNRITWQREKGRGAKQNWKNGMEDIWFAVKNPRDYYFNTKAVMMKRKILAPYRIDGKAKGWRTEANGNFRLTYPSNFWDDISIPFWSMPENTVHPTQKSEKLYAKLILASSKEGDMVLDPFLGSGTASVVAKKLNRKYCGIELNEEYCLLAEKRLKMADSDKTIQGYADGVFWERNTFNLQQQSKKK